MISTTKTIDFDTLYDDITHPTSGSQPNHDLYMNTLLRKGKLPNKMAKVIRKKIVTLGPAYISGSDTTGAAGSRNILSSKTCYMRYNNLKTLNRTTSSSQGENDLLSDYIINNNPEHDVYTIILNIG